YAVLFPIQRRGETLSGGKAKVCKRPWPRASSDCSREKNRENRNTRKQNVSYRITAGFQDLALPRLAQPERCRRGSRTGESRRHRVERSIPGRLEGDRIR